MNKMIFIIGMILLMCFISFKQGISEDSSDLISLDLKGMDIRDVMKILAQKSGFNIVVDTEVNKNVTLYVKDVSIMDVLDIVTLTNNLAYKQEGTLIRIMDDRKYESIHGQKFKDATKIEVVKLNYVNAGDAAKVLVQIKTNIGKIIPEEGSNSVVLIDIPENIEKMKKIITDMDIPLITEIFPLEYAKVELIKEKLSEMLTKGIGSMRFDERTNKIIVKDTPEKLEDIREVLKAFDERNREVTIDANIIQVTLSDKYSYGIDWLDIAKAGSIKLTGDTNLSSGLSNVTPSTLTVATIGGHYTQIISLLKTYGKADVLSRPRITVMDRQEAKILVGAKEPYVTSEVTTTTGGTYHTTDNVQFVDVGVNLVVVPQINREGFVTLKIKPQVSTSDSTKTVNLKNPDGSTRTIVPYVTSSEAETTVIVKDNTSIIIGGLMKDTVTENRQKVPFLGDIPLLGKLFTATGKSKEKTELVILITPHIVGGDTVSEETKGYISEWYKKTAGAEIIDEDAKKPKSQFQIEKEEELRAKWDPVIKKKEIFVDKEYGSSEIMRHTIEETPYDAYYISVNEEIDRALRDVSREVSGVIGEVQVKFSLDKQGFLTKGPVVLNNPDMRLVRNVVDCIKNISPFRPFPEDVSEDEMDFQIVIRYE